MRRGVRDGWLHGVRRHSPVGHGHGERSRSQLLFLSLKLSGSDTALWPVSLHKFGCPIGVRYNRVSERVLSNHKTVIPEEIMLKIFLKNVTVLSFLTFFGGRAVLFTLFFAT